MTILSKKQQAAIESRKANKELMSQRRKGVLALPLPTFSALNAEGLISAVNSKKALPVTFNIAQFAEDNDLDPAITHLDVHIRGKGATQWGAALYIVRFRTPENPTFPPIDQPFIRDIPVARLTEGSHEIGYIIYEDRDATPLLTGAPLEVDHTPPYHPNYPLAPLFPDYLSLAGEITERDIADHPEGMECTFPDYPSSFRSGDRIEVFFAPDFSSQLSDSIDTFPVVAGALSFTLPWSRLVGNQGGKNYLFYRLIDLAGNFSKDSAPARIELNLTGDPDPLEAYVPLALLPEDGVLDLQDLYDPDGVFVAIPEYDENLPDIDVIELTWGSRPPLRFNVGLYLPFPLMLPISRANLVADYGTATGELPTTISYFIDRNGSAFDAPDHEIDVDFSSPGPNPGVDPENDLLNTVLVYGSDPSKPNELTVDDFGNAATAEIVLWDEPIPAPGTTLRGYWGSLANEFDSLVLTSEGPGDTVTLTVPWPIIRDVGNVPVQVFYTLGWDTNDNTQRSPAQEVIVNANKVVLEPATFNKATATWACTDLNRTTWAGTVRVPGNTIYFELDMIVRCEFRVFSDTTGDTQLGDTVVLNSQKLTPDMVSNGFNITVPYTALRPAARNSVDFRYFVPIPGGGEHTAERARSRTRFTDLNGMYCEEQPPVAQEE